MTPPPSERVEILNDFVASTLIFSTAMNELLNRQVKTAFADKYTLAQLRLLKMVAKTVNGTVSDVAAFLGVSNAAASKAVDRMVRRNLIQRNESRRDRRAIQLSLTDEGHAVMAQYEAVFHRTLDGLFESFTPQEFRDASGLLDRLSADLVNAGARSKDLCFRCGIYFRDKCVLRDISKRVCYYHLRDVRNVGEDPPNDFKKKLVGSDE
jgi:DNA-binding MarR family transcriptional regulator